MGRAGVQLGERGPRGLSAARQTWIWQLPWNSWCFRPFSEGAGFVLPAQGPGSAQLSVGLLSD